VNLDDIREVLDTAFPGGKIELEADGDRLMLALVSDKFEGLNRVKRQQLVYSLLKDMISSGVVHAITMRTITPQEAES
jgi:acid stress-induced BolA-like protein IbaG/YrbA|tara:strand:+ start:11799 stop:12032 length:234 start_codon:yes stop_codon:yes gene_type:complete